MADEKDENTLDKTIVSSETTLKKQMAPESTPHVLVILMGPPGYQGKQWTLSQNGMVIGRAVESAVFIDDRSLSRSHARIDLGGNEVSIVDLGSTNKTIINGQTLPPMAPYVLKNNDQIRTGNVIFKFLEKGSIEAISNQAMYDKATRDALTGANTKGALLERGPEVIKRAEVLNEPLSIIVFDIDFFKKINDGHGHPGGDHVLKELGRIVSTKLIRSNDFFARYGGEEFVLILSGTPEKTAFEIGERIRQTVESNEFIFEGKKIPVTVSVGVTSRHGSEDWPTLFDRADKALYKSKQTGRNKVTLG